FSRLCFFSSRRRHTIFSRDWSSDVCSSDLTALGGKISFNFQTGAWSYQIAGDVDGDKIETFEYVIVDNDGDPSPATLTVHVEDKIGRAHSELQSRENLVCRLLLEKKNINTN